jgi:hypothetical protein
MSTIGDFEEELAGLVAKTANEDYLVAASLVETHKDLLLSYVREGVEDIYNALTSLGAEEALEELCWFIVSAMVAQYDFDHQRRRI